MINVYSKNNCPECQKAIALLEQKGVPFSVVKIENVPGAREFLIEKGHRAVPQIYYGDELVVADGYKGLTKLTDEQWAALK
jgi:glutaredoxin